MVFQIDAQMCRDALEVVSRKFGEGAPGHGHGACQSKRKRLAKGVLDLKAIELRIVSHEEWGTVEVVKISEQPRRPGALHCVVDEATDLRPNAAEMRLPCDHVRRDAVDLYEPWVEARAWIHIPVLAAHHRSFTDHHDPDRTHGTMLGARCFDIDANDGAGVFDGDAWNSWCPGHVGSISPSTKLCQRRVRS